MTRILARVAKHESSSLRFAAASVTSHAHALTLLHYALCESTPLCALSLPLSHSLVPLPCPSCLLLCVCCIEFSLESVTDYGLFNGLRRRCQYTVHCEYVCILLVLIAIVVLLAIYSIQQAPIMWA